MDSARSNSVKLCDVFALMVLTFLARSVTNALQSQLGNVDFGEYIHKNLQPTITGCRWNALHRGSMIGRIIV
jgi:hypothetical protein